MNTTAPRRVDLSRKPTHVLRQQLRNVRSQHAKATGTDAKAQDDQRFYERLVADVRAELVRRGETVD